MDKMMAIFFAVCAGIFTTFEAAINSKLARIVTPKIATLHNLITGVLILLLANLLKGSLLQYAKVFKVSPQLLLGGAFGALIIYLGLKAVPQLGVATTLSLIVVAQLISAMLLDTAILDKFYVDRNKLIGIILLTIGTYFILKE